MGFKINDVDYFYVTVEDQPGEAYAFLTRLTDIGVNLLAFNAIPVGPNRTQLTLFPDDTGKLQSSALQSGIQLDGPHPALLVQGDDELGALAEIHEKLFQANVNVFASTGVTDGSGSYGYIIYIRPTDHKRAIDALET